MSKQMKLIVGLVGVLVVAALVLTALGKPPNLPIPGLQGVLAKGDAATDTTAADGGFTDPGAGVGTGTDCGAGVSTGAADPLAGTDPTGGAATDPAAAGGAPADPAAAGGAGTDPAAGGATDPATGAPLAAGADGWDGSDRVVAAGDGDYDPGSVSDSAVIVAAEAVDPTTGAPLDPAAGGAADPAAAGGAADPAAAGGGVDPAAAGGAGDPCAGAGGLDTGAGDLGSGAGTSPDLGAGAGAGAGAVGTGAGAGAGAGAAGAAGARTTTDGANTGNSPEALRAAKDATTVMQKAKITVTSTATLVPSAGGIAKGGALRRYRGTVTGAVLVIKLDAAAQQQWTGAGKKVQQELVKSFLARLGKTYRKASRSVTVVDETGNVLAVGDAAAGGGPSVKLFA